MANEVGRSFADGLIFIANMLNTVTINKLVVPDLVQAGNVAVLDCQYSVLEDTFTLHWLFNGSEVYEWRPGTKPKVSGVLEGRLDQDFNVSSVGAYERQLRIVQTAPELSGEYTCRVRAGVGAGAEASQTASMLIFSPESEFVLDVQYEGGNNSIMNIMCIARGLYPQPDLTLEYNHAPIAQQQRVWRTDALYSAETFTRVDTPRRGQAVCRLRLLAAGYTAMRSHFIPANDGNLQSSACTYFEYSHIYTLILFSILTTKEGYSL